MNNQIKILNDLVLKGKSSTDLESKTEPITVVEEVVEPQEVVETSTESVLLEEDLKEEIVEDQENEAINLNKSQDIDFSIMGCEDSCDGCPNERDENWLAIEDMITDDLFPEEASIKIRHNKWVRESELKEIPYINESNKSIVDKCLGEYKEKYPERCKDQTDYDILTHNDDIWDEWLLYDVLVTNSLRNNDFIIANWPEDGFKRGNKENEKFHDIVRQFDVVFDVTLGGHVCQPYIVFNVCEKTKWLAEQKNSDYASEELAKINKKYKSDNWYPDGTKEYRAKEIELYKEGHIKFDIRKLNPEYLQCIRKVTHKERRKDVSHDIW